jgi:double-stranded uracil-DNA glycosylase
MTIVSIMTQNTQVLPDLLAPDLKLVLIGTAASAASAEAQAYYAHPGNFFWPTLHKTGLTPRRFLPAEFPKLLALGIGLTDIAKSATGSDAQIPDDAWDAQAVLDKIGKYKPRYVGFTSKTAAASTLGLKKVDYGLFPQGLGETGLFVLPSPSGRARGYWDDTWWTALARLAN